MGSWFTVSWPDGPRHRLPTQVPEELREHLRELLFVRFLVLVGRLSDYNERGAARLVEGRLVERVR